MFTTSPRLAGTNAFILCAALSLAGDSIGAPSRASNGVVPVARPTIILVHGAFADSSSWNAVTAKLLAKGYPVIAVANPLRGLRTDANYVDAVVASVQGAVVLVGHSYGGNVISNVGSTDGKVKALIYVAGEAPEEGESAAALTGKFPGSTLDPALAPPVPLADGGKDLYIQQSRFHAQFAADLPVAVARLMGVNQRPVTVSALNEPAGAPAWKSIPSWFIYGSLDKNIPPAVHAFMAKRAGARKTVEIKGASHVVMTSHPDALVNMIDEASAATSQ